MCDILAERFAERPRFFRCKQEVGGDLLRAVQSTFHNRERSYIEIEIDEYIYFFFYSAGGISCQLSVKWEFAALSAWRHDSKGATKWRLSLSSALPS